MAFRVCANRLDEPGGAAIQRMMDECAAAGGRIVEVPAGVYELWDAVHLRSGVRLVGEPGAVLVKRPSVQSRVVDYLGYGFQEFTVAEPDLFSAGMGVHIADDHSGGFYDTVATIIARDGDTFFIDRAFHHDYQPGGNAVVTSLHPLVEGIGVENASLESITLDGNPQETRTLNGCRGGGVFLLRSRGLTIRDVEVRGYHGDGISFQQCVDISVLRCHVHHNTGAGLHPGSGSVRYVMQGNTVHDNGGCGLFYCLRTSHSRCIGNLLEGNGDAGISIGERDTDHLVRGNVIRRNGAGIQFRRPLARGGDRVVIEDNDIGPNGVAVAPGEIILPEGLRDVTITHNRFAPAGSCAVHVGPGCERIAVASNQVSGREQQAADIGGNVSEVALSGPDGIPAVGPEALPLDGARHLGIASLSSWSGIEGQD